MANPWSVYLGVGSVDRPYVSSRCIDLCRFVFDGGLEVLRIYFVMDKIILLK